MASRDLSESQTTFPSDSENYDANHSNQDSSDEPPSSSSSPMILYSPPTIWSVLRGAAINLLLPFVNGLMLGFGELFAHEAAFRLGWSGTKLSSPSRPTSRAPQRTKPTSALIRPSQWKAGSLLVVPALASIRHASTAPPALPAQTAAAAPPPIPEPTSTPDISSISLDEIDLSAYDISQIPEKIGYLHGIGLNWWYGPTSSLEWLLEHIHVYSGMPWWGSIAATALVVRVALFPLYLRASDSMARGSALVSVTQPITQKMQEAQRAGDTAATMLHWTQLMAVRKRAGLSMTASFAPMVLQGVLGFAGFKLIRAMSTLPIPAFRDGGFLWLSDLTVPDPFGILPLAMAAAIHTLVRMGGESGAASAQSMPPGMQAFMLYGMPGIVILVMAWQPGALCVWFTVSGGLGMLQALALQRPAVRKYFRLAPLYKPAKGEAASNPLKDLIDAAYPKKSQNTIDIGGKNTGYMQPRWQAPRVNTSSNGAGQVLDVKGTSSAAPTASSSSAEPPKAAGGVSGFMANVRSRATQAAETKRIKNEKDAKKRAADAYERRASERSGRR
ncbi:hypothetical protein LTR02_015193 [Friedmanniomyces endolithicus]|nr:hypothetical protein LTR59_015460 [Friedmanniomyces endolithicus]KAK0776947.1 hypothetical protein LTR38_015339 [Friedmanniomyces endolithicus]KAK0820559.1 hypothetical protein LTR75_001722 [Friedmanniomyces endolithicus]KAK0831913.1 hypothetical protein LTR03_015338 [Friedmanniomyces endolithicus]KAK0845911.1 hypothetical protein LTS02_015110 [Friedmanniomyces endolithicus]